MSRDELLAKVWGYVAGDTRTVDVHVFRLRRKIEADPENPKLLHTVRGGASGWTGKGKAMKTLRGRMFALVAATILLALVLGLASVTDVLTDRLREQADRELAIQTAALVEVCPTQARARFGQPGRLAPAPWRGGSRSSTRAAGCCWTASRTPKAL